MSSDDDAEELAALRAQRAARMDGVSTLSQLRELQRRTDVTGAGGERYFESSGRPPAVGPPRPPGGHQRRESDDDEEQEAEAMGAQGAARGWSEEPDRMDDPIRSHLPMSFGTQERKMANPTAVHKAFLRSASPQTTNTTLDPGEGSARATVARSGAAGGSYGPPRPPGVRGVGPQSPPPNVDVENELDQIAGPFPAPGSADAWDTDYDKGMVGPPRPPSRPEDSDVDEHDTQGADMHAGADQDVEDDPYALPITHEAILKGHTKAVSCLDMEYTGTRMVTGSYDYTIRLYDFHGMKADMRSFRELEPSDGHPVYSVSWSPSGDAFLVVTGSAQAKIYDRDGRSLGEFVRGDMYIRDVRNTKGHISSLTGGWWHPTDRYTAITSSEDGTVRIWDTHNVMQKTVVKPTLARPVRTSVTSVSYNKTGSLIGAGLADGTIQVWSVAGKFGVSAAVGQVLPPKPQMVEKQGWTYVSKPNQLIRNAHTTDAEITSLCFSSDNNTMLSRSTDGTLKIWDLRRFQAPVHVHNDLPVGYAQTRAIFSPDESIILTGTGGTGRPEGNSEGSVVFFSRAKNELIRKVGMPGNVTALAWHHRLNQIFVGTGNRSGGETHALYDLNRSERGVVAAAACRPRKPNPLDYTPPVIIKTPHALPMFREDPAKKRKAEREAMKTRRPDPGMVAGRGKQGKLGATGGTLLTQHLLKQRGGLMAPEQEQDPREAILRHADKAKEEFSAWTAAYRATQPKPVYAQDQEEDEEDN